MPDTVRTLAALQTLLADNVAGDISAQDVRDMLVSVNTPEWMSYLAQRLPDETAHADDDFFETDSSADYTEITPSGTPTWTISRGLLSVKLTPQTAADVAALVKAMTPVTFPVTVETAFRLFPRELNAIGDTNRIGVGFTDGTAVGSNLAHAQLLHQYNAGGNSVILAYGGTVTNFLISNSGTFGAQSNFTPSGLLYLRCIWIAANTFQLSASIDGVTWENFGAAALSRTMTPTHVALIASASGADAGETMMGSFEYLRVYDSDLSV